MPAAEKVAARCRNGARRARDDDELVAERRLEHAGADAGLRRDGGHGGVAGAGAEALLVHDIGIQRHQPQQQRAGARTAALQVVPR